MAPYTALQTEKLKSYHIQKQETLFSELQTNGLIDHLTFAFYVAKESNNTSFIKVGSYDKEGFEKPDEMGLYDTVDEFEWKIAAYNSFTYTNGDVQIIDEPFNANKLLELLIDPSYPYIYIRHDDFDYMRNIIRDYKPN